MGIVPNFYSLLYVNSGKTRHANVAKRAENPLELYVKCAINLNSSCLAKKIKFSIITNEVGAVKTILDLYSSDIPILELKFDRDVPDGIPFYEAHFKLDAIKYLSSRVGEISALVDLDVVVVGEIEVPEFRKDILWVYDITETIIRSYKTEKVLADLSKAGGTPNASRWFGGEFIMGHAESFGQLSKDIDECWPVYMKNLKRMTHVGDEAVVSAALSKIRNVELSDVSLGKSEDVTISRYWSARTLHRALPLTEQIDAKLLHLPADKEFLANWALIPFEADEFLKSYKLHVSKKRRRALIANIVDALLFKRTRRFAPSL